MITCCRSKWLLVLGILLVPISGVRAGGLCLNRDPVSGALRTEGTSDYAPIASPLVDPFGGDSAAGTVASDDSSEVQTSEPLPDGSDLLDMLVIIGMANGSRDHQSSRGTSSGGTERPPNSQVACVLGGDFDEHQPARLLGRECEPFVPPPPPFGLLRPPRAIVHPTI